MSKHILVVEDQPDNRQILRDLLGNSGRCSVGQRIQGSLSKPPAGKTDEHCNDDCSRGVGPQPAERDGAEPDQHRQRGPHIRAEVQRIGFERLARIFFRDV